ncbi:MAG: amino acid adenylation domain-containing protein, partial [Clostridiales bacterium]|nr:amino acid adenylation domain-containing protein [Clostridiales bacterium]
DKQKKLFRKKLIENKISILDIPVEPHETEDGCYPLSCAQREIFPFVQDEEAAAAYVMCNAIRIHKNMNLTLLEQAMQLLIEKYEVMRIHFVEKDGTFFQKVKENLQVKITVIDLQDELPEEREKKMLEQFTKEGRIPFSVFDSPFFRLFLYRLSMEECVLGINIHHFITDGISLQMITADLLNTYADLEEGKQVKFTVPPVKFTDYALWQNEWIRPDMLQTELAFWKDTLKGIKACYSLPEDFKRPAVPTFDGGFYACQADKELTARIRACAAANRVSVFQFMLTVYMILVSRYQMDPDVALSTPVSGRLRKETQHIAGFFAQGMAIRTFIEEEKTFMEVLKKTASDIDQAFNNQIVPVDLIGEVLDEQESENIGNIFDMFFTFHNYQENYQESDFRIPFTPVDFGNHMAKGDLSIELTERNDHIDITMEYNLALYRQETIQAFIGHYVSMLKNCLDSPSKLLKEIGIEKEEALHAVYEEFNQTGRSYDYHQSLYSLIEEQAKQTPECVALLADGESFTYEELLSEAGKLHGYLLKKGITKGSRIGIRLESSKELLISLLAVLKAGCTYVPLDPGLPQKRAMYIQKKAGMVAVLQDEKKELDVQDEVCPVYYVGKEADFWKKGVTTTPKIQISSEDDAYIMFTSGSTGNPKGVQISHENAVNFLLSMKEELNFQEEQSFLSVTTYAFDISVLELFLPLVCGGKVILVSGQISADPVRLKQMVKEHHPDYVQATPALWQTLFANDFEGSSTITALCGGEALNKDLAKIMKHACKKVFNMYGPTETTVWSLMYRLEGEEPEVFIGKPIGNTTAYILDSNYKMVPPGVRGRLYIGGVGVSKGYLDNPEETDKRFIDNPFGDGRLFYTGDLAKCHADGTYEYCGRDDQQVKIRGYRIETKEIELCLKKQEIIENCAVVATDGCSGAKVLAAYIQLAEGVAEKPAIQELRSLIREELPEYMVPSAFIFLKKIPITYNFKIDRKKLMELKIEDESEDAYEIPQNRMQEMLVAIWKQAMQKERIGIKDDFYCIGGHSLSMIKIKELVYKKTGFSMSLSWFSKYPTIERMAEQLQIAEKNESIREETVKEQVAAVADKEHLYEPFDLTQVQTAYWVGRYSKGGLSGISTHIYRETTVKGLQLEQFEEAINMVIARHDMLRAIILEDGRQQIQKTVPRFVVKQYCFTESSSEEADAGLQQVRDEMKKQVFSSDKWPIFDVRFCQMQNGVGRIHMSFDCLIGDARSFQIILNELAMCYAGRQDELKKLEFSFRDYVITSKQLMNGEAYQEAKKYWMDKLPQIPDKPLLPLRCSPDSIYEPTFARKSLRLDRKQYQRLKEMAEQNHVTKTVVLLTAFSEILALYSKKGAFTLNLTLFDRNMIHPDIPDIVGDFTTGTLLEIDMAENETPQTYAKRIQERLMDNLEHRQFSSIDITRELLNQGYISESYPVVFTSMLDVYEEEHTFEESLMAIDDEESLSHNISQTPQVWLDHQAIERDGNLFINWDYVEDLFEEQVISSMFSDYQKLLLELLYEETWVKKEPLAQDIFKYPYGLGLKPALEFLEEEVSDELMITGFLEQVRKNGTKTAIIIKDRIITYEELNQISDSTALHILRQENSSECIGIVMEKGWEQIVAALAILKAGKAYVPIDAHLPEKRIEKLIHTCDLSMCLTTEQFADKVDKFTQPFILSDELFSEVVTVEEKDALDKARMQTSNSDKAYIIFTSGSTG